MIDMFKLKPTSCCQCQQFDYNLLQMFPDMMLASKSKNLPKHKTNFKEILSMAISTYSDHNCLHALLTQTMAVPPRGRT